MAKILFLLAIVFILMAFFRARGVRRTRGGGAPPSIEPMVACARCGVNVPMGESVEAAGRRYCSQEHLRLDSGDNISRG